ncbi:hypothetical protein BGZ83_008007 [Gryganskiella cystojenkinii]|nr:hypothetical protein BGZ83_008007 [Gryganskiella cystojenkinii]
MNNSRAPLAEQNSNVVTRAGRVRSSAAMHSPLLAPLRRSASFSAPSRQGSPQPDSAGPSLGSLSTSSSSEFWQAPTSENDYGSDDSNKTTIFDSESTPAPSRSVSPTVSQRSISEQAVPCSDEPLSPSTTPRSSPPVGLRAYLADPIGAPLTASAPDPRRVTFSNVISKLSPPTETDYGYNDDEASLPLSQVPLPSFLDHPSIEFSSFRELLSSEDKELKSKSTVNPPVQRGQKRSLSAVKSLEEQMEDVHLHLTKARRLVLATPMDKPDMGVTKAYRHLQSEAAYLSQEIIRHRYYVFYNHLQFPTPPTVKPRETDDDTGYLPSHSSL